MRNKSKGDCMTKPTNYEVMKSIDAFYLKKNFRKLLKLIAANSLIGIVEYYPTEGFIPEVKKTMAGNLVKTEYNKKWPGTVSSKKAKIDYYWIPKDKKDIIKLLDDILNYYGENDADATIDFFIEEDNEIILFITAHEEIIQVHKKFYEPQ